MKKLISALLLIGLEYLPGIAQQAFFDDFYYKGNDVCFSTRLEENQNYNPILSGFYPDPSICRKGDDFYLVNSSFSYFPGIPLFHSKDLLNWEQIGYVLQREEQVSFQGRGLSEGVYAPAISYNPFDDTFYIVNTIVGGIGNFVVKSKNPREGWSNPVRLPQVKGIDPSIFFDDDGKAYIVSSYLPEKSEWYGHRAIYMYEYDYENDNIIGSPTIVVNGGVDPSSHPQWLEGPHVYKVNGLYYMIMAEGGTHANHREVAFWSENVKGPYRPCKINPILSQAGLPESRPNKVINVGHADLVETEQGDWYAVFLGCRPYRDKMYNTGRETFLLPVSWKEGTPVILESGEAVSNVCTIEGASRKAMDKQILSGNFEWEDHFDGPVLNMVWNGIRNLHKDYIRIEDGRLLLEALPTPLAERKQVAFVGRRQQHLDFCSSVTLDFRPKTQREYAGLVLLQNEKNYVTIGLVGDTNGKRRVMARRYVEGIFETLGTCELPADRYEVTLSIYAEKGQCSLAFEMEGTGRRVLANHVDITHLSTEKAKGFVGCYIGMYATSAFEE